MSRKLKKPQVITTTDSVEPEVIELSVEDHEYLNGCVKKMEDAAKALEAAQNEFRGALSLIAHQKHLVGNWKLSDDNQVLVRVPESETREDQQAA